MRHQHGGGSIIVRASIDRIELITLLPNQPIDGVNITFLHFSDTYAKICTHGSLNHASTCQIGTRGSSDHTSTWQIGTRGSKFQTLPANSHLFIASAGDFILQPISLLLTFDCWTDLDDTSLYLWSAPHQPSCFQKCRCRSKSTIQTDIVIITYRLRIILLLIFVIASEQLPRSRSIVSELCCTSGNESACFFVRPVELRCRHFV